MKIMDLTEDLSEQKRKYKMQITQEEIAELEPWNGRIFATAYSPRIRGTVETINSSQEFTYLKTEEEMHGRSEALKRLTSKINSFISRYKNKFLAITDISSSYELLTIKISNKSKINLEKIKKIYPRFKFVAGKKYDFNIVESLYGEQILSNFQDYTESLKNLAKTNYMYFLETAKTYTDPIFEQNPEIDFICYTGFFIYFGKIVKELENGQVLVLWNEKFRVPIMTFIDNFTISREKLFYSELSRLEEKLMKKNFVTAESIANMRLNNR